MFFRLTSYNFIGKNKKSKKSDQISKKILDINSEKDTCKNIDHTSDKSSNNTSDTTTNSQTTNIQCKCVYNKLYKLRSVLIDVKLSISVLLQEQHSTNAKMYNLLQTMFEGISDLNGKKSTNYL